jgi:acetylornithine deacetylase
MVIVGEPTGMRVVNAHKSSYSYTTRVTGHEAHSSATHTGANAIMAAASLLGEVARIADMYERRGDPGGRFDPPFSTVHVGTIAGGTATNIIPRACSFDWEFRGLPGDDGEGLPARLDAYAHAHVLPPMRAVSHECGVETVTTLSVPGLAPDRASPAEALALALARQNETYAVSYGTEAGLFQGAGMPAVVCGPGDIAHAHKPNEHIPLSQIAACSAFMERLAQELRS